MTSEVAVIKVATFVRKKTSFQGDAALYHVNPPMVYDYDHDKDEYVEKTSYVVVSSVVAMFTGMETFIFPANKNGEVVSWGELNGSQRGTSSHRAVLEDAGYILDSGIRDAEVVAED